jgi:hypothetical protein
MEKELTEEKAIAKLIVGFKNKKINIIEKAEAVKLLYDIYQSVEEVSRKTTIEPSTINRYRRVYELPDEVKKLVLENKLSSYHVLSELNRIKERDKMIKISKNIVNLPREISREIIRYAIKNPDLSPKKVTKYVIDSYGEKYELFAYFILLDDNEIINKNIDINRELMEIKKSIKLLPFEDSYIAIMNKEIASTIKKHGIKVIDYLKWVIKLG